MTSSKEGNSYSWPFKLDRIHDYAYYDNFLSKKECEEIVKLAKTKQLIEVLFTELVLNLKLEIVVFVG